MKFIQKIVLVLGASVLSISGNVVSGQSGVRQCTSEECACEEALQQNTVEALEDFLRKYPHAGSGGTSACAALGVRLQDGEAVDQSSEGGLMPVQSGDTSNGG